MDIINKIGLNGYSRCFKLSRQSYWLSISWMQLLVSPIKSIRSLNATTEAVLRLYHQDEFQSIYAGLDMMCKMTDISDELADGCTISDE